MEKEYTIEEIEATHTYPNDGRVPHVPFGFGNAEWLSFKWRKGHRHTGHDHELTPT
jgi:hypothetical protein